MKDRGVRRYKKFIHKVCAVDADAISVDWDFLVDFAVVRDSIVHGNGNKSRLGSPRELDRVVGVYPDELSFKHKVKLVVSDKFVKHCMSVTTESALAVHSYMAKRLKAGSTP